MSPTGIAMRLMLLENCIYVANDHLGGATDGNATVLAVVLVGAIAIAVIACIFLFRD